MVEVQFWHLVLAVVLAQFAANVGAAMIMAWYERRKTTPDGHAADEPPLYEPSPALLRYCAEKDICPECARPLSEHEKKE